MTVVTESVRISVIGGRTQVDVAAPADVPLAALLPDVLALLHVDGAGNCWTLARVGGPPLPTTATLQGVDVHDGDLLVVTDDPPETPGAMVDDVAAGVAALTRESRSEWTADSARWAAYATVLLAAVVSAGAAVVAVCAGDTATPLLFTPIAAAVSMAAAVTGHRLGSDPRLCATLSVTACVFGAAAGVAAGGGGLPAQIALAGVVAGTLAVLGHRGTGTAAALHTAIATVGLGAALTGGLASVWSAPPLSIAATSAAIGVMLLPSASRISIALAGLPLPPVPVAAPPTGDPTVRRSVVDGVDALGPIPADPLGALADLALGDLAALSRRTAAASSYLTGILAGAGVWIVVAVTVTAAVGSPDTVVLVYCAAAAASLLVRGRVHADRIQSTTLILSGACAVAGIIVAAVYVGALHVGSGSATAVAAMCAAAALGAAGLLVGTVAAGRDFSPLQVRAVELLQLGTLVIVVPLLLWVLDAYRLVREW
ncbi:type VII secretion integral membrane protein EccD [Gordonia sp. MP11Mi]|uniref:ESX-5 secretion system protein EccD5 n=1 Tax=Gordonia sp. MP11Mi TaxID=3022769 RepID=A0AA97CS56_9ACTN